MVASFNFLIEPVLGWHLAEYHGDAIATYERAW